MLASVQPSIDDQDQSRFGNPSRFKPWKRSRSYTQSRNTHGRRRAKSNRHRLESGDQSDGTRAAQFGSQPFDWTMYAWLQGLPETECVPILAPTKL